MVRGEWSCLTFEPARSTSLSAKKIEQTGIMLMVMQLLELRHITDGHVFAKTNSV